MELETITDDLPSGVTIKVEKDADVRKDRIRDLKPQHLRFTLLVEGVEVACGCRYIEASHVYDRTQPHDWPISEYFGPREKIDAIMYHFRMAKVKKNLAENQARQEYEAKRRAMAHEAMKDMG